MKKWLDKYEQGGMVLKQKTTDNYFKKPNPNEAEVSMPPEYVGLGYDTTGRDYSPAWGGQFAMGGSLPGTVGFTYARIAGSAPANGKYTKKTKASAQKGKSIFKAPDVPAYAQGRESVAIQQPTIPLSDVDISRNKFRNETLRAKSKSPNITLSDWLTPGKLLAKQELSDLGENLDPFQYGNKEGSPIERILRSGILGSKEQGRKDLEAAVKNKPSDVSDSFVDEGKTRADLLQLYSRRPQQYNTLEPADYIPTSGHKRGDEYVKSKFVENALMSSILNQSDTTQPIPSLRTKEDIQRYIETHGETALDTKPGAKTKGIATKVPALGTATLSAGEENGRPYLSYYDLWDLNPFVGAYSSVPEKQQQNWHNQWKKEGVDIATKFAGAKPPKVYGRIYFDPETGRPIQKEDGGEIPQAQEGNVFAKREQPTPASESTSTIRNIKGEGKSTTATTGQRKEDVKLDTEGMARFKAAETKDKQERIAERKSAIAAKDKGKPFTLPTGETKKYEDMDWREKAYVSGKSLESKGRFNENDEALYDDINPVSWITDIAGGLATAPLEAREYDSNLPYVGAVLNPLIQGALGFDPLGGAMKFPGRVAQSMESGILSNTRKLNPFAENLNDPLKSYRVAGMDAARDFENTGVLRSVTSPTPAGASLLERAQNRPTSFPSFQKGYADMRYLPEEGGVVFETGLPTYKRGEINPVTGNAIRGRHYAHRAIDPNTGSTLSEIPGENIRMFGDKPHWLKGYQEVSRKEQGGVVKDDMGYWNPDNYGKVVEIDSPYITMEGVNEPLIGISDEGDKKYMTPGKNYKFKGKKVREYPVAKNGVRQEQKGLLNLDQLTNFTNYNKPQPGGWLDKY